MQARSRSKNGVASLAYGFAATSRASPFETPCCAGLLRVRVRGGSSRHPCTPDARHRPVFCPAPGHAGLLFSVAPERACGTPGGSPRPRRHVLWTHGSVHCGSARRCVALRIHTVPDEPPQARPGRPRKQGHPAFRTQRTFRLATPSSASAGALTKCRRRCIAGSLGRPPRLWPSPALEPPQEATQGPQTRRVRRIPLHAADVAASFN
jgi:hypothetical protein